jgi:hypothetical protein
MRSKELMFNLVFLPSKMSEIDACFVAVDLQLLVADTA